MCEFDAERSELFLSRAAILVEGMTEKISLPFVFRALGHDSDGEQISIVECGGKANMPLFIEICLRARVPLRRSSTTAICYPGREPLEDDREAERAHPPAGRRAANRRARAGLRGRRRIPRTGTQARTRLVAAWRDARLDELPEPLVRAVRLALDSAHPRAAVVQLS